VPVMCATQRKKDAVSIKLIPSPSGRSRNWYVDVHVPVTQQKLVRAKRVRRSTGTADRALALVNAAGIEAGLRAEWLDMAEKHARQAEEQAKQAEEQAQLRASSYDSPGKPAVLTPPLIRRICALRLADWSGTDAERFVKPGLSREQTAEARRHARRTDWMTRTVLSRGPSALAWSTIKESALEYAEDVGYLIAPDDPLVHELVREFAHTEQTAQEVIAQRNKGKHAEFPQPDLPGATLSELIPAYEAHRAGVVDPKSISKSVSIWQRLIAFMGDVPLDGVSSGDLYRFLEARLHASQEAWSQSYVDGHAKRALREMFALARTQGRMRGENPVERLETTPKLPKKEQQRRLKPRYPYTTQQLNVLFASDWYDPNASNWRGKMSTDLAGRYWCPAISTCHGLRVREVVQLVNSDFSFVGDVLFVRFQTDLAEADADTASLPERKLKNASALRTVPVHPKLCSLGLPDFVRDMQARHAPGTPLFPSAIPRPGGKAPLWGRSYEQAWLRYVRDELAFGHGYGNHSFRHQLEDRVRDAQATHGAWPAGLGEFFTGRRLPRAADRGIFREQSSAIDYGNGFMPGHIVGFVEQIDFEGVVFPPAYAEWLARKA